jgi:hypothetical protein
MLVIGIIVLLAGIVIVAVNPRKFILSTYDSKRTAEKREIQNAVLQYTVDTSAYPTGIPTGAVNAKEICRAGVTDSTCVNLDVLVSGAKYMSDIPVDPSESDVRYTGYRIYNDDDSLRPTVSSIYLGRVPGSLSGICFDNDVDHDGIPNFLDTDSDGDGRLDSVEGTSDPNGNGVPRWIDATE